MVAPQVISEKGFLGEEFLTWLWFCTEEEGGVFDLEAFGTVGVAFDKHLEFREELANARVSLRSDAVTRIPEAQAALASGKKLGRARLVVGVADENFELTLDGPTLDITGLKIPFPETDDPVEREVEETLRLTSAGGVIAALYENFLDVRLSPKFEKETLTRMRRWVSTRTRRVPGLQPARNGQSVTSVTRASASQDVSPDMEAQST